MARSWLVLVGGVAVATTAACGTTVATTANGGSGAQGLTPGGNGAPLTADSGLGASAPGSGSGAATTGAAAAASGSGAPGALAGPGGSSAGATGGAAPRSPAGQSQAIRQGPGVTATSITFGFVYDPGLDDAQRAAGGSATAQGNTKAFADAVVADINKHGGVAGRTLKLAYAKMNANDQATPTSAKWQAACATLTQDTKVLVAMAVTNSTGRACFQKAGVATTAATSGMLSQRELQRYPSYWDVTALPLEVVARNEARTLVAQGYFSGWNASTGTPAKGKPVLGILVPDVEGWHDAVRTALLPELAKAGITVSPNNIVYWYFPQSTQEAGQSVAEIQAAVLRFRSNGVTHFLPGEVNSASFFAQNAERQNYRPRYALNTDVGAQLEAGTLIPTAQLNGALGIGWAPVIDLPAGEATARPDYVGPGRAHCLAVMKAAGATFSGSSTEASALSVCDQVYSAAAAVARVPAGSAIDAASVVRGLEDLGGSFAAAAAPAALFRPGRHYAISRAWPIGWNTQAQKMTYLGPGATVA